jgi:MarR-like DNA-binding transcriptional regulator SgrR of sgrS sRNA
MRPCGLLLLVAVSVMLAVSTPASTRPHYGGTLRLATRDAPASLDPADPSQAEGFVSRNLSRLVFDTLVILDGRGQPQPALSPSWQVDPGNRRWQFNIRRGVVFHDGAAVSPDAVAASLRSANPNWKVFATAEAVVIECDAPTPNLPAILALPRYGIAKRSGGKLTGSGPFAISRWDPGKKIVLTARDDYWGGRAFVDAIEIEMDRSFREEMIALDLGKADIVEVAPDQARRAAVEGRRVESSAPAEWMGLVFSRDPQSAEEGKLRGALALSIDRDAMNSVLLQGGGEPAGTLLPNWMSGYAFLFPTAVDLQHAGPVRDEIRQAPAWTLGYDASDPLARVITERIALNARDAGLTLQPVNSAAADVRLVRIPLASLDAQVSLTSLIARLGLPQPQSEGDPLASLYTEESAVLQSRRVIPLLHLRTAAAVSANVRGWKEYPDGSRQLQNVWLGMEKP